LESFKELVKGDSWWTSNIEGYIGTVESNIEWLNQHEQDIADWLGSTTTLNLATPIRKRRHKPNKIHEDRPELKRRNRNYIHQM